MNIAQLSPSFFFGTSLRAPSERRAGTGAAAPQHLAKGATLTLRRPAGRTVECLRGTLWITQDGDPRDLVLEPGQSHRAERASPMLVHALSEGCSLRLGV